MPRRRRRRSFPWLPVLILVALLAGAYVFVRGVPGGLLPARETGSGTTVSTLTLPGSLDVCALATPKAVAEALGVAQATARQVGATADVPAQGACTWDFERGGKAGQVVAQVFTARSRAAGGIQGDAQAYFQGIATGFEYAYKEAPARIAGLGDEAAAGGYGASDQPAQLAVRQRETVLTLLVTGADRAASERLARALVPALP